MIDTLLAHLDSFDPGPVRARLGVAERYAVATLHRPANVDTPAAAARLVDALRVLAERLPVVLPLHPRGRATLGAAGLLDVPGIQVVDPLGYLEFLSLVRGAALVVTDSGGIQEETTVLRIPCLTLRPNTERPVTITHGTNRLVEPEALGPMVDAALRGELAGPADGPPLWDGHAGERIAAIIAALRPGRRSTATRAGTALRRLTPGIEPPVQLRGRSRWVPRTGWPHVPPRVPRAPRGRPSGLAGAHPPGRPERTGRTGSCPRSRATRAGSRWPAR